MTKINNFLYIWIALNILYPNLKNVLYIFYSKFNRKSISEKRLLLSVTEKKMRREKVENFTLNPLFWTISHIP